MAEPSAQDLYDAGRAVALIKQPSLVVNDGDVTDAMIWASAAMGELVILRGAELVAATFRKTATGEALTRLIEDHWGITRIAATKAIGSVTFSRASGAAGTIPAGTRVATSPAADGTFQAFTTDVDLVLALDASGSVAVTAEKAGTGGNVAIGTVNRILDTLFSTFTVSNAARLVGGAAEESDDAYNARVDGLLLSLRRGTLEAMRAAALQVEGVQAATAVEDEETQLVTVYVADGDGNSNAEMVNAVILELESWRAGGAAVQVSGGVPVEQAISIGLVVKTGVSAAALADRVRQAIVSAVNKLQPGEVLYRSLIQAAARAVDPTGIKEVTVATPAADIDPADNEVIRTNSGIVTVV